MSIADKLRTVLIIVSILSEFIVVANFQLEHKWKRVLSTVKFCCLLILLISMK